MSYRFECCLRHHKYLNIWRSLFRYYSLNKMSQKFGKNYQSFEGFSEQINSIQTNVAPMSDVVGSTKVIYEQKT